MANSASIILDQALELSSSERASVAEKLLVSLDNPDPKVDVAWEKEADLRIEAYRRGEIDGVLAEKVFAKYRKK